MPDSPVSISPKRLLVLFAVIGLVAGVTIIFLAPALMPLIAILVIAVSSLILLKIQPWGPLFAYEMNRIARNGRHTVLRCTYALTLLIVLSFIYQHWVNQNLGTLNPETAPNELARLGENFTFSILIMQNIAVFLLTPFMVCGAIAEERRTRSIDLLFISHLRNHEIVLGKMFARIIALGTILLGGLPVLALIFLWGGVSIYFVVGGFASAALTLLTAGSVSIFFSTVCRSYGGAVAASFAAILLVFAPFMCCPTAPVGFMDPIKFLIYLDAGLRGDEMFWGGMPAIPSSSRRPAIITVKAVMENCVFHVVFSAIFVTLAIVWLRRAEREVRSMSRDAVAATIGQPFTPFSPPYGLSVWRVATYNHVTRKERDPLLWKEWLGTRNEFYWALFTAVIGLSLIVSVLSFTAALVCALPLAPDVRARLPESWNHIVHVFGLIILGGILVAEGLRTSQCVSYERQLRTWESLLTVPMASSRILAVKGLAGVWWFRWVWVTMFVFFIITTLIGAMHPLSLLLCILSVISHLLFIIGLGLYLSASFISTSRASLAMMCVLLVQLVGPFFLLPSDLAWLQAAVNPLHGFYCLSFTWNEFANSDADWMRSRIAATIGFLCYGLAGLLFWGRVYWKLKKNPLL